MIIDAEHLRLPAGENIHLVRWGNDADHLESVVRGAAALLNHHVALLDGRALHTEPEVLSALADAFRFPEEGREAALDDWNVTADRVGDLAWLFAPPDGRVGVVTLLRDPEPFMLANLLQLAFVIDALGTQSQWVQKKGIPFHIVVGPLPEDYRYEIFLNQQQVSKHFCAACQSLG